MLVDDFWVWSFKGWDEFRDVVDLGVVFYTWSNFSETKRFVAIVATILKVGSVFQLLLRRKLEKLFANGKLTINCFLAETKVCDVEES